MTRDYIIPAARPFYRQTADLRREFFGEDFPASTGVVCLALNAPEWMIEINLVAVKGGKKEIVLAERAHAQGITFLPGVKKGNLFFVSGTTGHHPETGALSIGDLEAQTRQTYLNIAEVLGGRRCKFQRRAQGHRLHRRSGPTQLPKGYRRTPGVLRVGATGSVNDCRKQAPRSPGPDRGRGHSGSRLNGGRGRED